VTTGWVSLFLFFFLLGTKQRASGFLRGTGLVLGWLSWAELQVWVAKIKEEVTSSERVNKKAGVRW